MTEKEEGSASSNDRPSAGGSQPLQKGDTMENGKAYNGETGFGKDGVAKSNEPGADDFKGGWIR